jgi:predicted negative regulator of RcsB-dependent stress response
MAKKITQKELKHDEFVDAAWDFGHWLEENWKTVAQIVGGGIVLVVAFVLWNAWSARALDEKRQALAVAVADYGAIELGGFDDSSGLQALHGRFAASADELGGDESALVARFYLGATSYRLGRHDEARATLETLVGETTTTDTLGATARMMLARVELAGGRAREQYQRILDEFPQSMSAAEARTALQ